jgi:hypothetical protein
MRKKRKSFSLINKAVQNKVSESDILLTGYISKELFLLIENLSDFTKNNFAELSVDGLKKNIGLSLDSQEFNLLMKDLCNVSIMIKMPKKRGCFSIVDSVGLKQNECKLKLNESFIFLMNTDAFKLLSNYFDFEYLE